MAIIRNVVMRGASKRLGGVVFYTRSGETVARELAPSVTNPRTEVQMTQRIKLSNVVAAYKANKAWMAGAFEDKSERESDYNAFVRFNLASSRVALDKSLAAAGASVAAPYIISSGSIQSVDCVGTAQGVKTNLYTGDLVITASTTIAQLSAALLANNNGLERGMQLSLIINIQRSDNMIVRPYIVARAYEIIIDDTNSALLSDYIPYGILETLSETSRPLFFNGDTFGFGTAAFILSKTVSGKLKVSSQTLKQWGTSAMYDYFTSEATIAAAIQSYGESSERFLDSNSANEYNPSTLVNFIQAMQYKSVLYQNGATVPTDLNSTDQYFMYFAIGISQSFTMKISVDGTESDIEESAISWNTNRTRATLRLPSGITISQTASCKFIVIDGTDIMEFNFTADPQ